MEQLNNILSNPELTENLRVWLRDMQHQLERTQPEKLTDEIIALGAKILPKTFPFKTSNNELRKSWALLVDQCPLNPDQLMYAKLLAVSTHRENMSGIASVFKDKMPEKPNALVYLYNLWKKNHFQGPLEHLLDEFSYKKPVQQIVKPTTSKGTMQCSFSKEVTEVGKFRKVSTSETSDKDEFDSKKESFDENSDYSADSDERNSKYDFLNSSPPPGLFSSMIKKKYLQCVLDTEMSIEMYTRITAMTAEKAWAFCEENVFIPHFDEKRSRYQTKNPNKVPVHLEILSKELSTKLSEELNKLVIPSTGNQAVLNKLTNLETQLLSMGRIAPPVAVDVPVFQPQAVVARQEAPAQAAPSVYKPTINFS